MKSYLFTAVLEDGTSYFAWDDSLEELTVIYQKIKKYLHDPWDYETDHIKDPENVTIRQMILIK